MTVLQNDPPLTLSSIESLKAYLAGLVRAATDSQDGKPVLLTYVGGEFMKTFGVTFDKYLTALVDEGQISVPRVRRKLVPFVEYYCYDILKVLEDPPGTHRVVPLDKVKDPNSQSGLREAGSSALRFHRSVWAAFIRPLDGKRRYLNLDQIGFTDATEPPADGDWKEIAQKFVMGAAADARVNGPELEARIEEWARESNIPITKLIMTSAPAKAPTGRLASLLDLIDTLPDDVAQQWAIPAAVLKHLRSQR